MVIKRHHTGAGEVLGSLFMSGLGNIENSIGWPDEVGILKGLYTTLQGLAFLGLLKAEISDK
jgi:hypothetical protein